KTVFVPIRLFSATRSWRSDGAPSIVAALIFLAANAAFAQDNCVMWTNRFNQVPGNGVGTPGQRAHHAMAYDSDRHVTVFFGGEIGKTRSEKYFNDTWEYDGHYWTPITVPDPKPSPRSFHAMAYDPVRKKVVLYGGQAGIVTPNDNLIYETYS